MPKFRVFEIEEKKVMMKVMMLDSSHTIPSYMSVLRPMWESFDTLEEAQQKLESYPIGGDFTILPIYK